MPLFIGVVLITFKKKQQIKQPTELEHLSNFKIKQYLPTIQIH